MGCHGEARLAHNILMHLMSPNEGKVHILLIDNFFSNISLFKDVLEKGTYNTRTIRCNHVGLFHALRIPRHSTKIFKELWIGACTTCCR